MAADPSIFSLQATQAEGYPPDVWQSHWNRRARRRGRTACDGLPDEDDPEKLGVARRMLAEGVPKAVIVRAISVSRPSRYDHLDGQPKRGSSVASGEGEQLVDARAGLFEGRCRRPCHLRRCPRRWTGTHRIPGGGRPGRFVIFPLRGVKDR